LQEEEKDDDDDELLLVILESMEQRCGWRNWKED